MVRQKRNLIKLCFQFFKIGWIGFGGGSSLVPIIEKEIVEKNNMINKDEFENSVVIANVTPGALPVQMSIYIGREYAGLLGMILAPLFLTLPGVILSILAFYLLTRNDTGLISVLKLLTVGVISFVSLLLINYIQKNIKNKKNIFIIILVIMLTCLKNIFKLFNIKNIPFIHFSSIEIVLLSLFLVITLDKEKLKLNNFICLILLIVYVICNKFLSLNVLTAILKGIMIIYSVYRIFSTTKVVIFNKKEFHYLIKQMGVWLFLLFSVLGISLLLKGNIYSLYTKIFSSSFLSFGGGDAYLAIADHYYVGNFISSEVFYEVIVPAVNIVPGSILCKTSSLLGYYIGTNISLKIVITLLALIMSITASGMMVSIGTYLQKTIDNMGLFTKIKEYMMVVISGLLVNIILSLYNNNSSSLTSIGFSKFDAIVIPLFLISISLYLNIKKKKSNIIILGSLLVVSLSLLVFVFSS